MLLCFKSFFIVFLFIIDYMLHFFIVIARYALAESIQIQVVTESVIARYALAGSIQIWRRHIPI